MSEWHPLTAIGAALVGVAAVGTLLLKVPMAIFADQRRALRAARDDLREAVAEAERLRAENETLSEQVQRWRSRRSSLSRAEDRIFEHDVLVNALDYAHCGVVVSSPDGARWVWVNKAVERALGMTHEEVLATGWRGLMHPDDINRAMRVEGSAYNAPVPGVVFRFRDPGGGWRNWRFWCSSYQERRSSRRLDAICIVEFLDVTGH